MRVKEPLERLRYRGLHRMYKVVFRSMYWYQIGKVLKKSARPWGFNEFHRVMRPLVQFNYVVDRLL
jgi:hypothetical protein